MRVKMVLDQRGKMNVCLSFSLMIPNDYHCSLWKDVES